MPDLRTLPILLAGLLLAGCGTVSLASLDEPVRKTTRTPSPGGAGNEGWIEAAEPSDRETNTREEPVPAASPRIAESLEAEVAAWLGTPYQWGGDNRAGIDCSAFVQNVYAAALGLTIPRTTADQKHTGARVTRGALQTADLVFFHTPKSTDHVGIYLGEDRFAHASSSQGVMVSRLSEPYWTAAFTHARRPHDLVLDALPPRPVQQSDASASRVTLRETPEEKEKPRRRRTGW